VKQNRCNTVYPSDMVCFRYIIVNTLHKGGDDDDDDNNNNNTYLLTYLHTPWNAVLFEKLTGFQLVKKFPAFYGTGKFITEFTSARHLSLSWASSIQHITLHPTSWRFNIILLFTPVSPKWSFILMFPPPHQNPVHASPLPHTRYRPRSSHSSRSYQPNITG